MSDKIPTGIIQKCRGCGKPPIEYRSYYDSSIVYEADADGVPNLDTCTRHDDAIHVVHARCSCGRRWKLDDYQIPLDRGGGKVVVMNKLVDYMESKRPNDSQTRKEIRDSYTGWIERDGSTGEDPLSIPYEELSDSFIKANPDCAAVEKDQQS